MTDFCERKKCRGEPRFEGVPTRGYPVDMAGNVAAVMCAQCRRDWREYCFETKEFVQLRRAENRRQAINLVNNGYSPDSLGRVQQLLDDTESDILEAKKEMGRVAIEWLEAE